MSLRFITESLEKVPDMDARILEMDRLIPLFDGRLPLGCHNPPRHNYDTPKEKVIYYLNETKKEFMRLFDVCEYNISPTAAKLYSRWMRNSKYSMELLKLDNDKVRNLRLHELFPYWYDFDEYIHQVFKRGYSNIDLSKLTFEKNFIASGGFGEVYRVANQNKVKNANGETNDYALKLFYPEFIFHLEAGLRERRKHMPLIRKNIEDIVEKKNNPLPDAFINIHSCASSYHADYDTAWAYIADYFPGTSVLSMLFNKDARLSDKSLKGRILFTYANAMKTLHDEKRLFIDNGLDAILVNDADSNIIKLCDPDFITSVENISEDIVYPHHQVYRSQESLLSEMPTYSSDLESFALMVHHLIIGETFIGASYDDVSKHREFAKNNQREYKKSFVKRLPKHLGELLHGIISYPKDKNITANDFVQAIKSDFKM